jgi:hypothetical protein
MFAVNITLIYIWSYLLLTSYHGLINYIDIKAKCRPLKILTCEGTSWQLYIRVYRLAILVFLTQLCELLPL